MAMEIFRAEASHAALIGQLLWDFNSEFGSTTTPASDFAARFETLLEREDVLVYVSGTPDSPTGFAYFTLRPTPYFDGPLAQLEELYVVPEFRNRGLGTLLVGMAQEDLMDLDCREIHINVDEIDTDTRRFYEGLGFSNIQPGEDYRMLCYLKEL